MGKMCNTACYVTCQLSIKTVNPYPPRCIRKNPALKNPVPHYFRASASFGLALLSLEVFFI